MIPLDGEFDLKTVLNTQKHWGAANIFGFIAFTNSDADVIKVLRDHDYWNSFNEDSNGWLIFSVKPPQTGMIHYPEFPMGMMGAMVEIWNEPNANKEFLKLFDLEDTRMLPLFIVFAVIDNEIRKFTLRIKDGDVEEVYNSIKGIIRDVTFHLNGVWPEYRQSDNVYGVIESGVKFPRDVQETKAQWKNFFDNFLFFKGILT
jgi:hypothetical protein